MFLFLLYFFIIYNSKFILCPNLIAHVRFIYKSFVDICAGNSLQEDSQDILITRKLHSIESESQLVLGRGMETLDKFLVQLLVRLSDLLCKLHVMTNFIGECRCGSDARRV